MKKTLLFILFCILISLNIGAVSANASDIPNINVVINGTGTGASYIQINWGNMSGGAANFYVVERKINTEDFKAVSGYINAVTNDSMGDILLAVNMGSTCSYRVAVYDSSYKFISYTNTVSFVLTDSSEPSNFKATSDVDKIKLTWEYIKGTPLATIIERKADGDSTWLQIGGTTGSTSYFEDSNIIEGKSYTYRIRSILGADCYSRYAEASVVQTTLSKPQDINVSLMYSNSDNTRYSLIELDYTWSQYVNIVVERKENNGNFVPIKTLYNNETLYLDTVNMGSTYTYRIKAVGRYTGFVSPYSDEVTIIVIDIKAPTGTSALATSNTTVELGWQDNSNNESGYEIWRNNGAGTAWSKYAVVPANTRSFTDTNLSPASTYSYKVRAFSALANVHSYFSPEITVKTLVPDSNVLLDYALAQINVPTFTWSKTGATQDGVIYQLEKKGEYDLTWSKLPSFSSLAASFTDAPLTPYSRYSYRIKIIDTMNNSSTYSNTIEIASGIPTSPTDLDVSPMGANTAKLSWEDNSMNEDGFIIERYTDNIGYVQLARVPSGQTSFIDNLLTQGKIYSYRVASYNKSGISGYSNIKYFSSGTPVVFNDMANYSWAMEAVLNLADMGVLSGTSQSNFSPDANITRAEFTSMVVKALKLQKQSSSGFYDVAPSSWYYDYIKTAKSLGIVNGINGYFYPDSPITREDMAIILCKALDAASKPLKDKDSTILDTYADRWEISDYAVPFLSSMRGEGLINGKDGNRLAPKDYLKRAEAASIIWRVLSNK